MKFKVSSGGFSNFIGGNADYSMTAYAVKLLALMQRVAGIVDSDILRGLFVWL